MPREEVSIRLIVATRDEDNWGVRVMEREFSAAFDVPVPEELELIAAVVLDVVHCGVGFLDESLHVLSITFIDGEADTDGHPYLMSADRYRFHE
jgi:hypothetical protein